MLYPATLSILNWGGQATLNSICVHWSKFCLPWATLNSGRSIHWITLSWGYIIHLRSVCIELHRGMVSKSYFEHMVHTTHLTTSNWRHIIHFEFNQIRALLWLAVCGLVHQCAQPRFKEAKLVFKWLIVNLNNYSIFKSEALRTTNKKMV